MQVLLGYDSAVKSNAQNAKLYYDTQKLINGHAVLIGKSGSGKTHYIRMFVNAAQKQIPKEKRFRFHIVDVHGDIDMENISSIKFSESTDYGFNPLMINPHPDFGGVRKRIQSFIYSLNSNMFRLGVNQTNILRSLLLDLFERHGFKEDDPKTWLLNKNSFRTNPTVEDLLKFSEGKLRAMYLGDLQNKPSPALAALEKLNRAQRQMFTKIRKANKTKNEAGIDDELLDEIEKLKEKTKECFSNYIDSILTGAELEELLKYDSIDTLKSLVNHISNLNNIGIFKNKSPPFDLNNKIWRYDIKALSLPEKKLFVSFLCEQLYAKAMQRGETSEVTDIIVLDEAHLFINDESENPVNLIAKEGRKFGLGLLAASQSPTHFSDDFLSNVSTKILLGVDELYWNQIINKLKLKQEDLEWIVFHKKILVQVNNKGSSRTSFKRAFTTVEEYLNEKNK